jgi:ABC-2 type transport system permease protein
MGNVIAIFKRDVRGYFSSPIAYVVIGLFLIVSGIFFHLLLKSFLGYVQYRNAAMAQGQNITLNVNLMMIRPFLLNTSVIVLFMIPIITMRSFAEEKKIGTMELLLTSPLTNWQIILGKFLATYLFYFVMIAVTFLFMLILMVLGKPPAPAQGPEVWPILIGYIGLFLMGTMLIGIGNFISSLTENQIVAAVGTFGATMFLWVVGFAADFMGNTFGKALGYLSIVDHFDDFSKGVFDTSHLVFYLSMAFVMLFLTYQSIESSKWRG